MSGALTRIRASVARGSDRVFDRLRHAGAFEIDDASAVDSDLSSLRGQTYAVLVTFRRDGRPVPSPVWIALASDTLAYVKSSADAGKVKRIRNDERVLVAPSTLRGRPTGPAIRGVARIVDGDETTAAEATLAAAYGMTRRLAEASLGQDGDGASAYLAVEMRPTGHP